MAGFVYWPYDEVTLEASESRDKIVVKTPWIRAGIRGPIEPRADFETLLQKFQENSLSPTDIKLVNGFFKKLDKYPLCYILPFPKTSSTDHHKIQSGSLANASLQDVLLAGLQTEEKRTDEENRKISSETLSNLPRDNFEWDTEAALSFASQGFEVHPESTFTVARRYHFLELLENDLGKEVFEFVQALPPKEFAKMAGMLVKQNLYVTQECHKALSPALEIAQSARPVIEHFIQAERGHDKILGAAIGTLTEDPGAIPVSSQTIALMSLLQLAARRNLLAFAIVVDFFERSSYEKMDPLAKLLLKGGFIEAAKHINRHMEINDAGEHEQMGLKFLAPMASCDSEYVLEALKLAEAVSLVMNSVTRSTIRIAKKR